MKLNPFCMCCQIKKQEERIRSFSDEEKKMTYMKEILNRFVQAGDNDNAPSLSVEFKKFFTEFWGTHLEDYTEIKKDYNTMMLNLEDQLEQVIRSSADPLEAALIHARIGNYIDFAAMSNVDKQKMLSLIESENKEPLDATEYARFQAELTTAGSLVYLADNCGEIVLDKIAIKILREQYPHLAITLIVRGAPVVNDATIEDAQMCGLTQLVPVIGNGSDIGGTWMCDINEETRTLLNSADVILAKGQGNFETLHGCGLNIYYLFLCKCEWFTKMFQAKLLQGMFVNENRVDASFSSD